MDRTHVLSSWLHLRQERRVVLSVLVDSSRKREDVENCWWLELPRVNGYREFICHDQVFTRYYTSPAVHYQNALFRLVTQSYLRLILLRACRSAQQYDGGPDDMPLSDAPLYLDGRSRFGHEQVDSAILETGCMIPCHTTATILRSPLF